MDNPSLNNNTHFLEIIWYDTFIALIFLFK